MKRYEEFTSKYTKLGKRVADLSRIKALMHAVGDPQERLRFVHVAGTNGKGSICEMTARALTAAGYKTGLFTSPYIIRYNDRCSSPSPPKRSSSQPYSRESLCSSQISLLSQERHFFL